MRTAPLVLVGLALLAPASAPTPASCRPRRPTPCPTSTGPCTGLATNGSRTFLSGDFADIGMPMPAGAIVSARGGAVRAGVDSRTSARSSRARCGGWYVAAAAACAACAPTAPSTRRSRSRSRASVDALALSPDGATLWLAGRLSTVNGQPRRGVAAVDASDGQLRPWQTGESLEADDLALSPDGAHRLRRGRDPGPDARSSPSTPRPARCGPAGRRGSAPGWRSRPTAPRSTWPTPTARLLALDAVDAGRALALEREHRARRRRVTPDGRWLFVTDPARMGGPAVLRFDAATGARSDWSTPITSAGPIALSPDGEIAYLGRARSRAGREGRDRGRDARRRAARLGAGRRVRVRDQLARGLARRRRASSSRARRRWPRACAARRRSSTRPGRDAVGRARAGRVTRRSSAAVLDAAGNASLAAARALSAVGAGRLAALASGRSRAARRCSRSADGVLYLVGAFTAVDGVARPGLAALRAVRRGGCSSGR